MNRLLVIAGVVLVLFGVVGIIDGLSNGSERHAGTLIVSSDVPAGAAGIVLPTVRVRLDDRGTTLRADITKLAEAVGRQGGGGEKVDVETRDGGKLVERVRFAGTWYGTGSTSAGIGLAVAFLLIGAACVAILIFRRGRGL